MIHSTLRLKEDMFILCWGSGFSWEVLKSHQARSLTLTTEAEPRVGRHPSLLGGSSQTSSIHSSCPLEALPRPYHLSLYPELLFGTWEQSTMGTPNDQAVLQAIFNPDTPFGDVVGLDLQETEKEDEGKPLALASLQASWQAPRVCCRMW